MELMSLSKSNLTVATYLNLLANTRNIHKIIDYIELEIIDKSIEESFTGYVIIKVDEHIKDNTIIKISDKYSQYKVYESEIYVDRDNRDVVLLIKCVVE